MDKIINQIIEWGKDKHISNPETQFNKLAEEMLEAHEACLDSYFCSIYAPAMAEIASDWSIHLNNHLKEELGDIGIVWILLCNMLNVNPQEALEAAHNKNKYREGKTINGNFIKEEDLHDN